MDILNEICEKRKAQIEKLGFSFGHPIPDKRKRPIVPFLEEPGTILEIKRASPSKGAIAPNLDSAKTARTYIKAGTHAISCLTEENYFLGNLIDLQKVSKVAGKKVAVLRKDFLLEVEEVDIAYKCGADAVLLIARILEAEKLLKMAQKAFELELSVLLEIREESDIEKAFLVLAKAHEMDADKKIVLGINSRDLKTFAIDLLIPLRLKEKIGKLYKEKKVTLPFPRVISESGVTTPNAAAFVGNLGFHSVLIGEAAAKDPKNAKKLVSSFTKNAKRTDKLEYEFLFWKKIAERLEENNEISPNRPLVKICGLTNKEDAIKASELGADIIGFIFAEKSPRKIQTENIGIIEDIRLELKKQYQSDKIKKLPLMVGVIVEPESKEGNIAYELCYRGILDGLQFHACSDKADGSLGYPALPIAEKKDLATLQTLQSVGFPRILIDAKNLDSQYVKGDERYGGTGKSIPEELVGLAKKITPLWLSGGINPQNAESLIQKFTPELIDICSGIESEPGKKDYTKMEQLFRSIK